MNGHVPFCMHSLLFRCYGRHYTIPANTMAMFSSSSESFAGQTLAPYHQKGSPLSAELVVNQQYLPGVRIEELIEFTVLYRKYGVSYNIY